MGTTYYSQVSVPVGRSLFIATPAYEAVKPGYAYSLSLTTAELARHHVPFELGLMEGNCHVDDGRNTLVRKFLEGNCTDLLFIDSDLMWNAKDILRLLAHEDELICGVYPYKSDSGDYPVGRILHARENGLLEVSYAPTGMMRIRRSVFEKLLPTQSNHGRERPTAVFFERRFNGHSRDGGDVTFCRKWIAAGGTVVVDPDMALSHIGEQRWTGKFISYLGKDDNRAKHFAEDADKGLLERPRTYVSENHVPDAQTGDVAFWIARLMEGNEEPEVFEQMAEAYGNKPWAAEWEFNLVAWKMARALPEDAVILECGSGLSTAVLAASGRKVVAIDHSREFAEKTDALLKECGLDARIVCAPMNGKWYAAKDAVADLGAAMVVIDGPPRFGHKPGEPAHDLGRDRMWPLSAEAHRMGVLRPEAAVMADDVHEMKGLAVCEPCGTRQRPWCVGRTKPDGEPSEVATLRGADAVYQPQYPS